MSKCELKIDWASFEAAKFACENWHYSQVIPVGKLVKVGAWEDKKFIGVVLFGRGANNNMLKPYGLTADEGCELVRIALNTHKTPVSKIMAIAIKFLKKSNNKLRLVVSYADADQDHHGGIYQATNWIYTGLKNAGTMGAFLVHGKKMHPKSVHSKGIKQTISAVRQHLDPNAEVFITKGKHCYLMPLDRKMKDAIIPLSKQYPKRDKQANSDDQLESGGAAPTVTLQSQAEVAL